MASYSLALQLRAAEQVVKAEMPKRAMVTRVLLVCDIASAMLVIQLGLFTNPAFSLIPVFLLAVLSLGRWDWADARSECRWFDPRSMVVGLVAPVRYSAFGLTKGQRSAPKTAIAMVVVRLVCFIIVLKLVAERDCGGSGDWVCTCFSFVSEIVEADPDLAMSHQELVSHCAASGQVSKQDFMGYKPPSQGHCTTSISLSESEKSQCKLDEDLTQHCIDFVQGYTAKDSLDSLHAFVTPVFACDFDDRMPAMLKASCLANGFDTLEFHLCYVKGTAVSNFCAASFSLCVALSSSMGLVKLLNLTYSFFPPSAFVLLVLTHCVGLLMKPALMNVDEDKALRKKIKCQAKVFERQLENGSLNEALTPGRRDLAVKLFFFLLDILSDVNCLYSFFRKGFWRLAISQLVIFVVSACFQARTLSSRKFLKAMADSWKVGIATDVLFKILLAEKTFEAPLSLFLQYFSAFWVTSDTFSFISLWASMLLSTVGISSGLYASKHLLIVDFELVEEEIEISMVSADLSPQIFGANPSQPKQDLPFPPPGFDPPGLNSDSKGLSFPPPGMGPPGLNDGKAPSFPPPGLHVEGKEPRRPGQFASATE